MLVLPFAPLSWGSLPRDWNKHFLLKEPETVEKCVQTHCKAREIGTSPKVSGHAVASQY